MITPYRKKLIEVALPLDAINKESAHEKMPGIGPHPRGIHQWWSRKPLTTCRIILFSSLVDDPSSWPELFPTEAEQEKERQRLFSIIEKLVMWDNSNDEEVLLKARTEIARSIARNNNETIPKNANEINKFIIEKVPSILDPFCGGGSIPIEAQRLGLKAYASDLNPLSVIITKACIEIPPLFAGKPPVNPEHRKNKTFNNMWPGVKGLAVDINYYSLWMRNEAEKRIGNLYPKIFVTEELAKERPDLKKYVGQELKVIAWLWVRTVASPNPAVNGAHVPLTSKFLLSNKKGKERWVEPVIDYANNNYKFIVRTGIPSANVDPKKGTVTRTGATCILSDTPMSLDYIRNEGKLGHLDSRLMAIVAEAKDGRIYFSPISEHEKIAKMAQPIGYPETDLPQKALSFRVQLYGFDKHYKLFTNRQLLALTTFSDLVKETREKILADAIAAGTLPNDNKRLDNKGVGPEAYADAVATYLALIVDRCTDFNNSLTRWVPGNEKVMNLFARQALPMVWDYAEANILEEVVGGFITCAEYISECVDTLPCYGNPGEVHQFDASADIYKNITPIISTDPPYYSNIGYADLSDFFYIWLRRSLSTIYPSLFSTLLAPKTQELIATPYRHDGNKQKAKEFFQNGLIRTFSIMRGLQNKSYPFTIFYAFKQAEDNEDNDDAIASTASTGWESMLNGLISAGFSIHGTWPIRSEQSERAVAMGTNALASSIVLVCHSRSDNAPIATRREFISSLKSELPSALKTLQRGNIAPVDFAQAAIGPGMSVFTRYSRVMEADGSQMTVRTALTIINQVVDEVLAEQEGEFDPDTRWAVAWFEQYGMGEGTFGIAETLSKAKNCAIDGLAQADIVSAHGGKVKLIQRSELPEGWDPTNNGKLTVWKATQYLIKILEQDGEQGAADLLKKLGGGLGENAKDLAYRLYNICERKKWSQEALSYNSLIMSWPEITKLVQSASRQERAQRLLFEEQG